MFEWFVEPAEDASVELAIRLSADALEPQQAEASGGRVLLGVDFAEGALRPVAAAGQPLQISAVAKDADTVGQPSVQYVEQSDAWEVTIPRREWPAHGGPAYDKDLLERISHFDLKLENPSDEARELSLRFVHDYHPITGYVPMLLDTDGRQTGLPLQNSKNWHKPPDRPFPYQALDQHHGTLDAGAACQWGF